MISFNVMSEKVRIGIPRALFFYDYCQLYKTFFEELGCEVIVSDKTNKQILASGLSASNNELCLPIKLLYGHVMSLKENVDYIFIPYIISTQEGGYICPKLIGAPDIIKANIDVNLLSIDFDMHAKYSTMIKALRDLAFQINPNPVKLVSAYRKALEKQEEFDKRIKKGFLFDEAVSGKQKHTIHGKTIAIIGHTYVFNDDYTSSELISKLRNKNIKIVTSDMLTYRQIKNILEKLGKKTHWNLGNRVFAAAMFYARSKDIDGIIYVTPFSCSSDSLVKEFIEANMPKKPFMTITFDEHSGDAGLITRIEAFLDMIDRRLK